MFFWLCLVGFRLLLLVLIRLAVNGITQEYNLSKNENTSLLVNLFIGTSCKVAIPPSPVRVPMTPGSWTSPSFHNLLRTGGGKDNEIKKPSQLWRKPQKDQGLLKKMQLKNGSTDKPKINWLPYISVKHYSEQQKKRGALRDYDLRGTGSEVPEVSGIKTSEVCGLGARQHRSNMLACHMQGHSSQKPALQRW